MTSLKAVLGWRSLRAGTGTIAALLLLLTTNTVFAQDTEPRPPRAWVIYDQARDYYGRSDYQTAALYFAKVQDNQSELSPKDQKDLQDFVRRNTAALQAQQEGHEKLRRVEEALRLNKTQEANTLLLSLQANQFLTAADKQKLNQFIDRVLPRARPGPRHQGGPENTAPTGPCRAAAQRSRHRGKTRQTG